MTGDPSSPTPDRPGDLERARILDEASERPFLFRTPFAPLLPARLRACQLGLIPFAITLVFYLATLPTHVPGEHAGEFLVAAWTGGVPHSPGYPVWCAVAAAMGRVLGGSDNAVWAIALVSALAGAASCGLVTIWLRQQDVGRRVAVAAGIWLGVGAGMWQQSVWPGPATFGLFLTCAQWVCLYQWLTLRTAHWSWLFVGAAALAVGNDPLLAAPVVIALGMTVTRRALPRGRVGLGALAIAAVAAGAAGLRTWWTARELPYLNAGHVADGAGVLRHWLGESSGTRLELGRVVEAIGTEHSFVAAPLALFGLALVTRRFWREGAFLGLLLVAPILTTWASGVRHDGLAPLSASGLFLASYAVIIVLAAFALDTILQRSAARARVLSNALTVVLFCLPLVSVVNHYSRCDYSDHQVCHDYARSVLESLPPDAILVTGNDFEVYPLMFHQAVLGRRPDVLLTHRCGEFEAERLPVEVASDATITEVVEKLLRAESRPVFATTPVAGVGLWESFGLVYRPRRQTRVTAAERDATWQQIQFSQLPPIPPAHIDELRQIAAPFDATAQRIAYRYYGAIAGRYRTDGDIPRWDAASRLAGTIFQDLRPRPSAFVGETE